MKSLLVLTCFVLAAQFSYAISGFEGDPLATCARTLEGELRAAQKRNELNKFTTIRQLEHYKAELDSLDVPTMKDIFASIPNGSLWLDWGSGLAYSQRGLLATGELKEKFSRLVAATYNTNFHDDEGKRLDEEIAKLEQDRVTHADRFTLVETGDLEEALNDPNHPLHQYEGQVDFLSEVFGSTSYLGRNIGVSFAWIARLLKLGAPALINWHEWGNQIYYDGRWITAKEFLDLLPRLTQGQLRVKASGKSQLRSTVHIALIERVQLRVKKRDELEMQLTFFRDNGPPERKYVIVPKKR